MSAKILKMPIRRQQQVALPLDQPPQLTQWFPADVFAPERTGWYNVRFKMTDDEREQRQPKPARRWFDGSTWSIPCQLGADDEYADDVKRAKPTTVALSYLEWQGLTAPQ